MVLSPTYYLADFFTGEFRGVALPLEAVKLSSNFAPGQFSASLDMRKIASSFNESAQILDMLKTGRSTLVPVVESSDADVASHGPYRALGEWWISVVDATYSDPVVRLSGPEWAGYTKETLITRSWKGTIDAWLGLRQMLARVKDYDQTIQLTLGLRRAGFEVEVDVREGDVDYWTAIESLQDTSGGQFEWRIESSVDVVDGVPRGVSRNLRMEAPDFRVDRTDVTLELTTPGTAPASLIDFSRTYSEHQSASTVIGRGGGAGASQLSASSSRSLADGEPAKTRLITVRDAVKTSVLRRATRKALLSQRARDAVFQVSMPTDRYTPAIGELYSWRREPSWSMPETYSYEQRCVGWSWASPRPGTPDVYTVDLVEG